MKNGRKIFWLRLVVGDKIKFHLVNPSFYPCLKTRKE